MNKAQEKVGKNYQRCYLNDSSINSMEKIWYQLYTDNQLRRCSKCILPETMPFIDFDNDDECNYCRTYKKTKVKGKKALWDFVAPHRSKKGEIDCIISLSGGRDSSFGLHYIKKVLGMNPVAYTYDWGMATPVAYRNQERMCQALGIKRIIISANSKMKKDNLRKNVEAWLKDPNLGMIPLLMAGDKHLIYHAQKVKQRTGIPLMFHCIGNKFEDSLFKVGFSNVYVESPLIFCRIPLLSKIKIASYYMKQFLINPAYINTSLFDTIGGYLSLFFLRPKDNDIFLFNFIKWDEQEILSTLMNDYGWERPLDTKATWRIDDGVSAFYNYIYMTVAGFTENDTFRSDQIREGLIDRAEALEYVKEENKPRYETIGWYARQIDFDVNRAIKIINAMPKVHVSN